MICAIHQPQYFPWLGYFDKMARADVFVLLDNVQFKKNEWQNRNRIRTPNGEGWQWLTVPVIHDHGQLIREVKINNQVDWAQQHRRAVELNYTKARYYREVWPALQPLFDQRWDNLCELNVAVVRKMAELLSIKTRIVTASELSVTSARTERLVDICRVLECDTYVAGSGCSNYMDFDLFKASGIKLEIQDYQHPVYPQVWSRNGVDFVSHLSALDLIMNCGQQSLSVLRA